jgi:Fur family ferric uptake transcriptional regulator
MFYSMAQIEEILRSHGLRVTKTRSSILKLFIASSSALSNKLIEESLPKLDRITLYRTLRTFEDKGIIHQAIDNTTVSKFALCAEDCDEHHHKDHHAHFHCQRCMKTYCIEEVDLPKVKLPHDFFPSSTYLVVEGICPDCKRQFFG